MGDFHPTCPKCATPMERGHVPDAAEGLSFPSAWAPGAPQHRRFLNGIKTAPKEELPLHAYRCSACGYVEFYARPA